MPIASLTWLGLMVGCALFADLLPLADPGALGAHLSMPPFSEWSEPLGTDQLGRSILARVCHGSRVSLGVALIGTGVGALVGLVFGTTAGYRRGALDHIVDVGASTLLAFPPLVLLIAIGASVGKGLAPLACGLGLIAAPTFIRIARANAIAVRDREYVVAAELIGSSRVRILVVDVLPNVVWPVISYAVIVAASLIVAEGSISFLGLGVPPPTPSWGGMIAAGRSVLATSPHVTFVPGAAFFLSVLSLNGVGDWLRRRVVKGVG